MQTMETPQHSCVESGPWSPDGGAVEKQLVLGSANLSERHGRHIFQKVIEFRAFL